MAQPYIGEIRMFGGNFAPADWAFCSGQLLSIADNNALFALIGTTYGGDGQVTFGLPDLRGRIPAHMGTGPGLSTYTIGEAFGTETVTLVGAQIPAHQHTMNASTVGSSLTGPSGALVADAALAGAKIYAPASGASASLSASALVGAAGGQAPHDNVMPYVCVSFIICLFGIFPSQN